MLNINELTAEQKAALKMQLEAEKKLLKKNRKESARTMNR
jgi:hypothetical protein